jgi:hypothetical protein
MTVSEHRKRAGQTRHDLGAKMKEVMVVEDVHRARAGQHVSYADR